MSHTIEIRLKPATNSAAYVYGDIIVAPWFPGESRYHVTTDYTFYGPNGELFAVVPRDSLNYFVINEDKNASPEV